LFVSGIVAPRGVAACSGSAPPAIGDRATAVLPVGKSNVFANAAPPTADTSSLPRGGTIIGTANGLIDNVADRPA
jgi:hypothetical protein